MDIKKKVGCKIKALRKSRGFTQEKVALITGLDRTYVNSVENGKRNISIVNLQKITKSFDIDLKEFFEF